MFDRFTDAALRSSLLFMRVDTSVLGTDLRNFKTFCQTVDAVKTATKWAGTGYKGFDQALWIMGGDLKGKLPPADWEANRTTPTRPPTRLRPS